MSFAERGLAGAALILALASLRGTLGRALPRRAVVALWWVAAARLLLPWEIPCRFSAYTLFGQLRPAAVPTASQAARGATTVRLLPVDLGPSVPRAVEQAAFPAVSFKTLLWVGGSLLLALWFTVSYIRCRQRFKLSLPVENACVVRWAREHPGISVRVSDQAPAPLAYGVLHPVILLPKRMDWGDDTALRHILTHEYIHIRHLDSCAKLVFAGVLCLHWWNPAVWLLYILANRDLELACDEAVVRRLGDPAAYARTLLRMEEIRAGLYVLFSQSPIEERIKTMMKFQHKRVPVFLTVCALLLAACVTTAFATSARQEAPRQTLAEQLAAGISCEGDTLSFTLPEADVTWELWIAGRIRADGADTGVRYLEEESAAGGWQPGRTYRFQLAGAAYSELTINGIAGEEPIDLSLLPWLPQWERKAVSEQAAAGDMTWPTEGVRISSGFGGRAAPGGASVYFHNGVDIVGETSGVIDGAPVYAALDGTVAETGYDAKLGNYVLLRHEDGLETLYAACREVCAAAGDEVARGETIALVGSTGQSTGPHLHFEVRQDGTAQDPLDYFKAVEFSLSSRPAEN